MKVQNRTHASWLYLFFPSNFLRPNLALKYSWICNSPSILLLSRSIDHNSQLWKYEIIDLKKPFIIAISHIMKIQYPNVSIPRATCITPIQYFSQISTWLRIKRYWISRITVRVLQSTSTYWRTSTIIWSCYSRIWFDDHCIDVFHGFNFKKIRFEKVFDECF